MQGPLKVCSPLNILLLSFVTHEGTDGASIVTATLISNTNNVRYINNASLTINGQGSNISSGGKFRLMHSSTTISHTIPALNNNGWLAITGASGLGLRAITASLHNTGIFIIATSLSLAEVQNDGEVRVIDSNIGVNLKGNFTNDGMLLLSATQSSIFD